MTERRRDRYEIGDKVEFIDEDPYIGFGMAERHRKANGPGPYVVEDIEPAHAPWLIDTCPHPQLLHIQGGSYSGAWFKPLREPAKQFAHASEFYQVAK